MSPGRRSIGRLAAFGLTPADVTDIILTHLRFDHVGWCTQKGEVVFRNATVRSHADDWAHFMEGPDAAPGAVRKLTPVHPHLELFDTDRTIAPGVDVRHAPLQFGRLLAGQGQRSWTFG